MRLANGRNAAAVIGGAALALLVAAPSAEAHLVTTGLGPVYDGIGHFFLSPEDAIAVLVLALFVGERGPAAGRRAIWVVPLGWLASGLVGLLTAIDPPLSAAQITGAIALSLLLPGLLVAADLRLPPWLLTTVVSFSVALHGFFNGVSQREAGAGAGSLALLGIALTTFVLVTIFAALVVSLRIPWTRIVVRVAGSWIAAMGLLLLGWALRPSA